MVKQPTVTIPWVKKSCLKDLHLIFGGISFQLTQHVYWINDVRFSYFLFSLFLGTVTLGVAACGHSVLAFEPHSANFKLLEESVALNPSYASNIWTYQKALGNTTGTTCVSASSSEQGNARIVPGKFSFTFSLSYFLSHPHPLTVPLYFVCNFSL